MTGFSLPLGQPATWFDRRPVLLSIAFMLAFGFWFAHLQWWWKANDDSVHQYFNALKLSYPAEAAEMNDQALAAMERAGMDVKSQDRLKLRVQVTYNWLLTSLSINAADRMFGFVDPATGPPDAFPKQLVSAEIAGFFAAFSLTILVLILAIWARFDDLYLKALVVAFALMFAMALLHRVLSTEFAALFLVGGLGLYWVFRRFGALWGFSAFAIALFLFTYGVLDALVASEIFDARRGEIVQPQGGLFEFLAYSLDTLLYPRRCCSAFGYFARSNFNLLLILVFALRWSDRPAAAYLLLAGLSLIHVAQSGMAIFLLLGADVLLRPGILFRKSVLASAALAVGVFLARQGAWPEFVWFSERAFFLVLAGLAGVLLIMTVRNYAGRIVVASETYLSWLLRLQRWAVSKGPILADLMVVGLGWLGLSLFLFVVVKSLGRETVEEMNYLSQVALTVTPRRLLSMLQASFVFGLVLFSLNALAGAAQPRKASFGKWLPRAVCLVLLVIWGNNAVLAVLGPFPLRQIERMEKLHKTAETRPPFPDRDFHEARMYYLMALYARTGHYVPNGFFRPREGQSQ